MSIQTNKLDLSQPLFHSDLRPFCGTSSKLIDSDKKLISKLEKANYDITSTSSWQEDSQNCYWLEQELNQAQDN